MDQRQLAFSINGGPSVLATKASPNPNPNPNPDQVRFDHVFDVKGASKMLDAMLPEEVLEASGLAGASGK